MEIDSKEYAAVTIAHTIKDLKTQQKEDDRINYI